MASPPRFRKTVFENGLTLVTERHPEFRTLSMGIWVKAGTRNEQPSEAGVSHFLEHMLFKGTEDRDPLEIALSVDRVGGDFNAFTAREYTCFHITLLDRDMNLGLDILSDVVLNSNFDSEELERERRVILQEISMVDENPEELVHDLFFEVVYPRHGLGRPILGTDRSIRRMSRADLVRYFRKHYRPDQIIVSLAGNISHDTVKKRIKALTRRNWPGRPKTKATRKDLGFQPAPKPRGGLHWVTRPTEQVHLVWGVPSTPYASPDRFASLLLNVYLGGGMSSRLFQEIREKNGLAYTVYSSLSPFHDSGMFTIYAATSMSQVPLCLRLIEECVTYLQRELLTEEELEMIRNNLKGTLLLAADDLESRMSSIAKNEIFFKDYYPVAEVLRLIDQVTPQDIRRLARKLLRNPHRSILAMGPRPTPKIRAQLKPKLLKL